MRDGFPLDSIILNRGEITIRRFWKDYSFKKSEIKKLTKYKIFLVSGIKIEHKKSYPSFIVFWPLSYSELKVNLEHLGYNLIE